MHFIIGFAILVAIFALFPRTALTFATLAGIGGALLVVTALIYGYSQTH
jgi:hypothetical protein